jgi:hypothetical protein
VSIAENRLRRKDFSNPVRTQTAGKGPWQIPYSVRSLGPSLRGLSDPGNKELVPVANGSEGDGGFVPHIFPFFP